MTALNPNADLCDEHPNARVLPVLLHHYSGLTSFSGYVETVQVFEDNVLVHQTLDTPGRNRILVIDGYGSMHRAIAGGSYVDRMRRNGWLGMIVHGAIRDAREIGAADDIGYMALGTSPRPGIKRGEGRVGDTLRLGGVAVASGDWLSADADGVVVLSAEEVNAQRNPNCLSSHHHP